ncbi:nitroreductase family protein [Roseovarius phycicola]|uniref:Nitroreductase family protein n=1 Tax=Roseovarius phycicola TaxID=3080976 RepID=A0ABZ2HKK8_9RHOB
MTSETSYRPLPLADRRDLTDAEGLVDVRQYLDLMRTRHSIRDYSNRPVPQEIITTAIAAAGTAPSGANQQPWFFAAISDPELKAQIREAAEAEEEKFYSGRAGDAWLAALEPIGTGVEKPHLTQAPWLIVIFAQRYGVAPDGTRQKHYYVPESVGIATGILITALHAAGLYCLTHTPNPMGFLNQTLDRPEHEKPVMILAVGHATEDATVPAAANIKKPLEEIMALYQAQTSEKDT